MRLYVLFAQRRESYSGEFLPEALESVTEFQIDENPDLLPGLLHEHQAKLGNEIEAINWVSLEVDASAVKAKIIPHQRSLKATVVP
jgi:hypothetical protein